MAKYTKFNTHHIFWAFFTDNRGPTVIRNHPISWQTHTWTTWKQKQAFNLYKIDFFCHRILRTIVIFSSRNQYNFSDVCIKYRSKMWKLPCLLKKKCLCHCLQEQVLGECYRVEWYMRSWGRTYQTCVFVFFLQLYQLV